jgi:hypothetical protein
MIHIALHGNGIAAHDRRVCLQTLNKTMCAIESGLVVDLVVGVEEGLKRKGFRPRSLDC